MKYDNESATTVGTVMFGVFCIFIAMAGVMYIAALNNQTSALTDTYGNAQTTVMQISKDVIIIEFLEIDWGATRERQEKTC